MCVLDIRRNNEENLMISFGLLRCFGSIAYNDVWIRVDYLEDFFFFWEDKVFKLKEKMCVVFCRYFDVIFDRYSI